MFAEQMKTAAGERHIMGGKREEQTLRRVRIGIRVGIQNKLQQLGKRKTELATVAGEEAQERAVIGKRQLQPL